MCARRSLRIGRVGRPYEFLHTWVAHQMQIRVWGGARRPQIIKEEIIRSVFGRTLRAQRDYSMYWQLRDCRCVGFVQLQ